MKKYLIIFIFLLPLNCFAENLSVIDINYLAKNSKIGKSINSSLDNDRKKFTKNFENKEKKFQEKNKAILVKKNLITEAEFNKAIQELQKEVSAYNVEKKKTLDEFKKNKEKEFIKLYKKINEILIEYAKENDVNTIIDKKFVIISRTKNDITNEILKVMNK
jgi:Skp family chaperone for outer membrane proteins